MAVQSKVRMTAAAYYQHADYTQHELIQLIDGEVIISVPPTPKHQAIVGEILFLFMTTAKKHSGRAFTAPIEVYLDEHNVYQPDVLYLTTHTTCRIDKQRLTGAPDLVVEVLSPSTAKFDRQEKYQAYEHHGVQEYWIVDPVHEVLEVWLRGNDGFVRQGAYAGADSFISRTLEGTVAVQTLFKT
ncbi:MAG: Uma2 family endonuclease [Anaerolineae bacterium]|nr:Uma2 family endonuclease [Anaerolineae bacterium]